MPYSPVDVAESVMRGTDRASAKKVQKLLFYAHVIHLARTGTPLVREGFQAWRDGPVSPTVYNKQRGNYAPSTVGGEPSHLSDEARESVRLAIELYEDRTESALISLSHGDGPWTLARGSIPPSASSQARISDETIAMVLVPTIQRLLDAHQGRRMSFADFEAAYGH